MPAALVKMTAAERQRYVRWWIEESGLTRVQLREVAGVIWSGQGEFPALDRSGDLDRRRPADRRDG